MSSLNIPNALTNGSTADATEVQQNFDAIETHTNTEMINRDGSVAMTAQLLLSGAPTSDLGAATKAYADGVLTTDTVQTSFIQDDAVTHHRQTVLPYVLTGDIAASVEQHMGLGCQDQGLPGPGTTAETHVALDEVRAVFRPRTRGPTETRGIAGHVIADRDLSHQLLVGQNRLCIQYAL